MRSTPPIDEQQDWYLIRAEEEDGYTTLEFWRNFISCDSKDRNILVCVVYKLTGVTVVC